MVEEYDSDPKDIIVCICPSIRRCCFEVSTDVKDLFKNRFSPLVNNINDYVVDGKKITRTEEPYYEDDGTVKTKIREENEDGEAVEYFE